MKQEKKKLLIIVGCIIAIALIVALVVSKATLGTSSDLNEEIALALSDEYDLEVKAVYVDGIDFDDEGPDTSFGGVYFKAECGVCEFYDNALLGGYYDTENHEILASAYPYYEYRNAVAKDALSIIDSVALDEDWSVYYYVNEDIAMTPHNSFNSYNQFKTNSRNDEYGESVVEIIIPDNSDYPYTYMQEISTELSKEAFNFETHFIFESDYDVDYDGINSSYIYSYPEGTIDSAMLAEEQTQLEESESRQKAIENYDEDKEECDETLAEQLSQALANYNNSSQFIVDATDNGGNLNYFCKYDGLESDKTIAPLDLADVINTELSNNFYNEDLCSDFSTEVYYSLIDFGNDGKNDFVIKVSQISSMNSYNKIDYYFIFTEKDGSNHLTYGLVHLLSRETEQFSINSSGYVEYHSSINSCDYYDSFGIINSDGTCDNIYTHEELDAICVSSIDEDSYNEIYDDYDENLIAHTYNFDGTTYTVVDVNPEIDKDEYDTSMALAKQFIKLSTAAGYNYVSYEKVEELIAAKEQALGTTAEVKGAADINWTQVQ